MAAQVGPFDEADRAGRSAQAEYERRYTAWRTSRVEASLRWIPLALVFALLGWWYLTVTTGIWLFGVVLAVLVVGAVADVLFRPPHDLRELRQIAAGERATGRLLARLQRDGYLVLHDRKTVGGRVDVEHLLVGPAGMFVLDSRNWASLKPEARVLEGKLWVGRDPLTEVLEQLRGEAADVAGEVNAALDGRALSASVPLSAATVLVVHGKRVAGTPRVVCGVAVLEGRHLLGFLGRTPAVWERDRVRQVALAAERVLRVKEG
jgi:hypothetical protein